MRAVLSALALVVAAACSTPAATPTTDAPSGPASSNGSSCPCTAPFECRTVVGMQPDSAREECWIPCGDGDKCPSGMTCTMIHDGPGEVCRKTDD